jgi:hypothetical protein
MLMVLLEKEDLDGPNGYDVVKHKPELQARFEALTTGDNPDEDASALCSDVLHSARNIKTLRLSLLPDLVHAHTIPAKITKLRILNMSANRPVKRTRFLMYPSDLKKLDISSNQISDTCKLLDLAPNVEELILREGLVTYPSFAVQAEDLPDAWTPSIRSDCVQTLIIGNMTVTLLEGLHMLQFPSLSVLGLFQNPSRWWCGPYVGRDVEFRASSLRRFVGSCACYFCSPDPHARVDLV